MDFMGKNKGFEKQEKDQITEQLQTNGFGRDLKIKKIARVSPCFIVFFCIYTGLYMVLLGLLLSRTREARLRCE